METTSLLSSSSPSPTGNTLTFANQRISSTRRSRPIFVYVHGLYGCYLSNKKQSWLSSICTAGFNLPLSILKSFFIGKQGHTDLALPITWSRHSETEKDNLQQQQQQQQQDTDDYTPSDDFRLSHSDLIDFLDTLHAEKLIQLHKIRWDWRRAFEESEKYVSSQIETIRSGLGSESIDKITIMTHSTGALLSWPTINKHPEWFATWVNVAGAVGTSNMMLHELQYDWKTPGMEFMKLLSKEVLFTFPSQYGFFRIVPEETFRAGDCETEFVAVQKPCDQSSDGDGDDKKALRQQDKNFLLNDDIDLYNVEHWEQFNIGIFSWKKGHVSDVEKEHLRNCLESSKRYRMKHFVRIGKKDDDSSFLEQKRSAYDHLEIICYGQDSLDTHAAYEVDLDHNTVDTSVSKVKTKGDGTLNAEIWQHVFGGLERKIVYAEENSHHVSMCNDLKLKKICLKSLFPCNDQRELVERILGME